MATVNMKAQHKHKRHSGVCGLGALLFKIYPFSISFPGGPICCSFDMATSKSALFGVQYLRVRDAQLDELNIMGLMLSGSRQQPSFAKGMVSVITIMSTTGKTLSILA